MKSNAENAYVNWMWQHTFTATSHLVSFLNKVDCCWDKGLSFKYSLPLLRKKNSEEEDQSRRSIPRDAIYLHLHLVVPCTHPLTELPFGLFNGKIIQFWPF